MSSGCDSLAKVLSADFSHPRRVPSAFASWLAPSCAAGTLRSAEPHARSTKGVCRGGGVRCRACERFCASLVPQVAHLTDMPVASEQMDGSTGSGGNVYITVPAHRHADLGASFLEQESGSAASGLQQYERLYFI